MCVRVCVYVCARARVFVSVCVCVCVCVCQELTALSEVLGRQVRFNPDEYTNSVSYHICMCLHANSTADIDSLLTLTLHFVHLHIGTYLLNFMHN